MPNWLIDLAIVVGFLTAVDLLGSAYREFRALRRERKQ